MRNKKKIAGKDIENRKTHFKEAQERKRQLKLKKKKYRFLGLRMWFSVFISHFYPDMDTISDRMHGKLYIGNNEIVTKNSKTALILVYDLGVKCPKFFPSILERRIKRRFRNVKLDFVAKTEPYIPDSRTGLDSRVEAWTKTLKKKKNASQGRKDIASRCLYTVDLFNSKVPLFKVRYYVEIRVGNQDKLQDVVDKVEEELSGFGVRYKTIKSNIDKHIKYIAMINSVAPKDIKDIPWLICTTQTLAEISPNAQGVNDVDGMVLGTDLLSMQPYIVNFFASPGAKNIYIQAPAGNGKTFIAVNWCVEARDHNMRVCIRDLKGNEFTSFTRAYNGIVYDLGPKSNQFPNVLKWDSNTPMNAMEYTNKMLTLTKTILMILSKVKEEERELLEIFVNEFINALYSKLGAVRENRNTWYRTETLTPYTMFEHLKEFISTGIRQRFGKTLDAAYSNWSEYFTPSGLYGHTFMYEIKYEDFIHTDVLTFTFDMLSDTSIQDIPLYEVKTLFANVIEDDYLMYNKLKGLWTLMIEEESSIASDFILESYVKNFLLRRVQNVINVMLGNSLSALLSNKISKSLMDTINMLVVGGVNKETRDYLVAQYDLSDTIQKRLKEIKDIQTFESTFVVVNMLQKKPVNGLLKVFVPRSVTKNKLFKGVDTYGEESKNHLSN